jgi:DNA invertase Pin-like site-specific DNA recombinase
MARAQYARFVAVDGAIQHDGWMHPIVAGSDQFAKEASRGQAHSTEVPRTHRATHSLGQYQRQTNNRNEAIRLAYASGVYSLAEIARHFGLHYSTVSRVCRAAEAGDRQN